MHFIRLVEDGEIFDFMTTSNDSSVNPALLPGGIQQWESDANVGRIRDPYGRRLSASQLMAFGARYRNEHSQRV